MVLVIGGGAFEPSLSTKNEKGKFCSSFVLLIQGLYFCLIREIRGCELSINQKACVEIRDKHHEPLNDQLGASVDPKSNSHK